MLGGKLPAESIVDRESLKVAAGKLVAGVADAQLAELLRHVGGDGDLALSALQILPRPDWVERIVGPIPRAALAA